MESAIELRRELHAHPSLSADEDATARRILSHFEPLRPDRTLVDLGGSGLAFVFAGATAGPTVMLRCELDALPIRETLDVPHRSRVEGVSHKCGHDGHMAILASLGARLARARPETGRVVLLFQPAEETGQGAVSVIADPRFHGVRPDLVLALHNIPGYELGSVIVKEGIFSSASRGMVIGLSGRTAHAAQPETGNSPARAMVTLVDALETIPETLELGDEVAFATIVGARLGEKAFGTAPGEAEIYATLRSGRDETMERMVSQLSGLVRRVGAETSLRTTVTWEDVFDATVNSSDLVASIRATASRCGLRVEIPAKPFRWSEDFGRFGAVAECALFGLGAGLNQPDLHDSAYDFPDELVSIGAELLGEIVNERLGLPE